VVYDVASNVAIAVRAVVVNSALDVAVNGACDVTPDAVVGDVCNVGEDLKKQEFTLKVSLPNMDPLTE